MKSLAMLSLLASAALMSCGQDPAPPRPAQVAPAPAPAAPVEKAARESGPTITANNYTGGEYVSGVSTKGPTSFFYFLISPDAPFPVRVGSRLTFAKSGSATVTRVDTAPQGGKTAVFVHVDKALDPAGDGYPYPIRVD